MTEKTLRICDGCNAHLTFDPGRPPTADWKAFAEQTGLSLNAVRLRARKHGWSNRDRQRDAVRAANRRRAERQAAE